MYAVIKTGGKQYKVAVGQKLKVEQLATEVDSKIKLDQVLLIAGEDNNIKVGAPYLQDSFIEATVLAHGRGEKIRIFKLKRRKHYQKHQGHRQNFTEILINSISSPDS